MKTENERKVLVVDDESGIRLLFRKILEKNGYVAAEASTGKEAVEVFAGMRPDAVLLDLQLPDMDGIGAIKEFRNIDSDIPVIFVTAHGSIPFAVEAMRHGAYDFIDKAHTERLMDVLGRAIEKLSLTKEVKRLSSIVESSFESWFGRSGAMENALKQISKVASSDLSVIIEGETGSGKTFIARAIHDMSRRAEMPFVKVDIGAMPDTLVESELFGYERGAFTGAEKRKAGLIEMAAGGTLLLDDLENLSTYVQGKLLGFVEEKKMYPVGSPVPVEMDVRIIAATNRDVRQSIAEGKLREDLFYRLSEFVISVPPLRERREDIVFFANRFLLETAQEMNKKLSGINPEAVEALLEHRWSGNLRELKNVIRRAVLLSDGGRLDKDHLEFFIEKGKEHEGHAASFPLKEAVRDAEMESITKAFELSGGNKKKMAGLLQIDYKTLLKKMKEYKV